METENLKLNHWAVGLSLASVSALLRFWALSQTGFANGWDSYFYLVQLKSLEETGRMHSPEASLIYPYLRAVYQLAGDYVVSLKAGSAALCALWTGVVWWLAAPSAKGTANKTGLPVILAAWTVFSPHLTYFAAQYPKNLLGAALLVAFMASLRRLPDRALLFRDWLLPLLLLLCNYFGHRLTFVLALLYGLLWVGVRTGKGWAGRAFIRNVMLLTISVFVLLVVAGRFFPGLFHWIDLGRLGGALSSWPQFAPYSFVTRFGPERISGWWMAEIGLVAGFWLFVVGYWLTVFGFRTGVPQEKKTVWPVPELPMPLLCTLLLFPFLEWSFTGISYRFFLVFLLLGPLLAIGNSLILKAQTGLIFAGVLFCCSFFSWKTYNPELHDPDYGRFAHVTENARKILETKGPELVVAHNALAEFFTFSTGTDAMPWLPEYAVDSARLWRIAAGVHGKTLEYYVGNEYEATVYSLGYGYYLLPEFVWQAAVKQAEAEDDADFLAEAFGWLNPSKVRPGWLLQRKRGS